MVNGFTRKKRILYNSKDDSIFRKKNPGGKNPMEKVYHIYAKNACLYKNLTEGQFKKTWITLNGMVGIMKTDYVVEDLSYEETTVLN